MNRYKLSKAGIDVNDALRRLSNDKDLYEELLQRFVNDLHYDQLVIALTEKNTSQAFIEAHALKGITGNLSLVKLHAALIPFVEELRNGHQEQAENLFPPVESAFHEVIAVLKPIFDE